MEHVAASDKEPTLQLIQKFIAPAFRIIGNGCEFRDLWNSVATSNKASGTTVLNILPCYLLDTLCYRESRLSVLANLYYYSFDRNV